MLHGIDLLYAYNYLSVALHYKYIFQWFHLLNKNNRSHYSNNGIQWSLRFFSSN